MSERSSNARRVLREVAQDARMRELVDLRVELEAEYNKVSQYSRIPGILRRGILSGINTSIELVQRRIDGKDQPTSGRGSRSGESQGG